MSKIIQDSRSLKSFGVAGLLSPDCKIYYDSLFGIRHIGRVSDLLVAQLRHKKILSDDLRLRLVLLRSLYEAYCLQGKRELKAGDALRDPLVIECGVDSEKIAIGVCFLVDENESFDLERLKLAVEKGTPTEDPLTALLRELFLDSDQVVLRVNPTLGRVEVVSLIDLSPSGEAATFEAVIFDTPEKATALSGEYIELGDLDYQSLLKNEIIAADLAAPATGELLAQGTGELYEAVRLKSIAQVKESKVVISGVTEHLSDDQQLVRGETPQQHEAHSRELDLYKSRTEELQNRIRELERAATQAQLVIPPITQSISPATPKTQAVATQKGIVRELIEKVWPFKATVTPVSATTSAVVSPALSSVASIAKVSETPVLEKNVVAEKAPDVETETETDTSAAGQEVRKLVSDEVGFIESTLKKVEQESQSMKKDLAPKAQKWVEGMVGDLIGEKARLNELGKKLSVSIRQKEVEFRNKEIKMQEELRKKDEAIRQRTHAYNRAREQVTQITSQLERAKAGVQTTGEELQAKQRYAMSQKLLQQAKEENQEQLKKIEELREQLTTVQNASKEKKSTADYLALKTKFDRVSKQAEEFKRANQQLLEKLNEATRPKTNSSSPEDLKRRLDVSMKLAASYQKDAEKLKLKIEEYVREENRLKGELARVSNALRLTTKKPPGESGTDQAA